jgi:hypothetical protein
MSILCWLGKHNFNLVEMFSTDITKNGKHHYWEHSWTGFQCTRCKKRKIKQIEYVQSAVGVTQQAYDWLNATPAPDNPTMLKLVQK